MKYFFLSDLKGKRHIIIAEDLFSAKAIATTAKLEIADAYELEADTFNTEGFLISDK